MKGVIGISPQETSNAEKLTVEENLQFIANIYRKPVDAKKRVEEEMLQRLICI